MPGQKLTPKTPNALPAHLYLPLLRSLPIPFTPPPPRRRPGSLSLIDSHGTSQFNEILLTEKPQNFLDEQETDFDDSMNIKLSL